ncbi:MAG: hypothetical protein HOC74_22220 [Gemmatimonadetes bacterium]|jgi:hypothetical protein|nr:hypothetical protein [Gemmatimonadota bacterium]
MQTADAIRGIFSNCVGPICGQGDEVGLALSEPAAFDPVALQEDSHEGECVPFPVSRQRRPG